MAKSYTVKLKGAEQVVYTSAVIGYRNLALQNNIDDSIPSRLLEKADDSKIKLSELELKHLMKAVQLHRNSLLENGDDTTSADSFLKMLLSIKQPDRGR